MNNLPRIAIIAALVVADSSAATAQADSATWWRETARKDLAAAREIMNTRFITALNSPGPSWTRTMDDATRDAESDVQRVRDAASYQSVLKRFIGAFDDAHVRVRFSATRTVPQEWAGFLVRYQGNHFTVVESERPEVKVGSVVTGCDGRPIDQVLAEIMPYEQARRHLELESSRSTLARILFVDAVGSLRPRYKRCRISGSDIALSWQPIAAEHLAKLNAAHGSYSNNEVSVANFGPNNAWVRMGTFGPSGESARQFARAIEQAASLRDKNAIVFDVRGNGGGSYNWFMGFIDALYGEPYADYYARARLQFVNVMSEPPSAGRGAGGGRGTGGAGRGAAPAGDVPRTPPDRNLNVASIQVTTRPGANGTTLRLIAPDSTTPVGAAPPNPVKARVFVLTDNGCGSACISFVDEMRRFPGVLQIGRDTYVDSRPGSPANYDLPSGEASISAPSMVREVRQRGDNFAWKPEIYFDGDIANTDAVREWILNVVLKSPR